MLLRAEVFSALVLSLGIGLAVHGSSVEAPAGSAAVELRASIEVSFSEQIMPILVERCAECHSGDNIELGLNMETYQGLMAGSDYGTVVEAGDPDSSLLVDMIMSGDMPEDGDPVPPEELELIKTWIAEGALNN